MRRSCSTALLPSAYWFDSGTGDIALNVISRLLQSSCAPGGSDRLDRPIAARRTLPTWVLINSWRDFLEPGGTEIAIANCHRREFLGPRRSTPQESPEDRSQRR